MLPAALPVRQRLHRLGAAVRQVAVGLGVVGLVVVGLVIGLGLTACGPPAEPGLAPSADAASASQHADRIVIDITIADGTVTPNGQKLDVAVGQQIALHVSSDVDDEIHAHTDDADGYELAVAAGVPASGSFTISSPGSFEVESHQLEKTIVILNVR